VKIGSLLAYLAPNIVGDTVDSPVKCITGDRTLNQEPLWHKKPRRPTILKLELEMLRKKMKAEEGTG